MTSKRLFFNIMKEDMRHKIWMVTLSCLGSFLMLPVSWLVIMSINGGSIDILDSDLVMDFFGIYLTVAGTCFTIAGALITGLCGFRFVFHKKMIDTYHSIPVKRRTLFLACYFNGFLIWFVPLALSLTVTLIMGARSLMRNFGAAEISAMLQSAGLTMLILFLVFLLVYHLTLTAVMLSGNILNTLVSMIVLGVGVSSIYLLGLGFAELFLGTFYVAAVNSDWACYASPLVSAIYLVVLWAGNLDQSKLTYAGMVLPVLVNAVVAVLLWLAAYGLYRKRPSELAEQGVKNKVMSPLMKLVVSITAAMGGWLFFYAITMASDIAPAWGVFGALLFGILSFGVMDIIFSMDFKAFFAHKRQMIVSVAASLLIAFAFYGDWFGYDHYLPGRNVLAEIAVYDDEYSMYVVAQRSSVLDSMHIQDADMAYAFLERMADRGMGSATSIRDYFVSPVAKAEDLGSGEPVTVRVTLKSGRTYYRQYYVTSADKDVAWPLYTCQEYLANSYLLPEDPVQCSEVYFSRVDRQNGAVEIPLEQVKELVRAYNQDVLENPDVMLTGQARSLVRLNVSLCVDPGQEGSNGEKYSMLVYDTMKRTIEVLDRIGYGEWVADIPAENIEELHLILGASTRDDPVLETVITDPGEIREFAQLFGYVTPYGQSSAFREKLIMIDVKDVEGHSYRCRIPISMLPEKYYSDFNL